MVLNSRSMISALNLDGNETLLTNYANKRYLTAIITVIMIRGTTVFILPPKDVYDNCEASFSSGFWKQLIGDGIMVRSFSASFSLSYTRKLICEIIDL
jgi:hypothetical protein